jgi:cytochrome c biogenesis protein CcdA
MSRIIKPEDGYNDREYQAMKIRDDLQRLEQEKSPLHTTLRFVLGLIFPLVLAGLGIWSIIYGIIDIAHYGLTGWGLIAIVIGFIFVKIARDELE